jgi:hypothetical protein
MQDDTNALSEKLKEKERAEEDVFFGKRDRVLLENSVNQRFPSGPAVMSSGPLPGEARNSVKHSPRAEPVATSRVTASTARSAPLGFMIAPPYPSRARGPSRSLE